MVMKTKIAFGEAIELVKTGGKIFRDGWNGKHMWVAWSPGCASLEASKFWSKEAQDFADGQGGYAEVLPLFIMKTADGKILMGWLASQSDMNARDWNYFA